jgi:hypothetical protein
MRPKTPQFPGGPGAGGMDTMTMAYTGVTAVPRVRGLRPVAGFVLGGLPPCPPWRGAQAR